MRSSLACLAAALLATSTLTTQIATACGGSYESVSSAPQVMILSSHYVHGPSDGATPQNTHRLFALTGKSLDLGADAPWQLIAPRSYDSTGILALSQHAKSPTVTLIGASGTRIVRGTARVALHHALFISNSQFEAVELPTKTGDDFTIALAGNHPDAVWHRVDFNYSYTSTIAGTTLSATRSFAGGRQHEQLSADGQNLGTYDGALLGVVDVGAARYAVLGTDRGTAYTLELTR